MEEMERQTSVEKTSTPAEAVPAEQQGGEPVENRNVGRTIAIVLGILAFVLVVSFLFYGAVSHPLVTSVLRDISIIVLALVTMITSIFLAILLFQLQSLIVLLRDEVQPILESINETAGTVRGTTSFVSDAVVTPMIEVASYATAVRQTISTLFGRPGRRGRSRPPGQPPLQETPQDETPQQ